LLLNNQIYGLTKGQYSPTSKFGTISNSSPYGNIDKPFNPVMLALASECSFVARALDSDPKHLAEIIKQSALHRGTSFVEILQNCVVFNDSFTAYRDQGFRQSNCVYLQPNMAVRFGKQLENGLGYVAHEISIIHNVTESRQDTLLVHHPELNSNIHFALAQLQPAEFPLILGIFRAMQMQTYSDIASARNEQIQGKFTRSLKDVFK
jgi:2-oxoglutarate ferredoxin oxidoreductase subunit beta